MYLEEKETIDYSGLETYCDAMIREEKINWFPIKKAIAIDEGRNKEKKDLPGLYRRLHKMEAHLKEQHAEMKRFRRHQSEQSGSLRELKRVLDEMRGAVDALSETR